MQKVQASGRSKIGACVLLGGEPDSEGGGAGGSDIRTPPKSSSDCFDFPAQWETSH